MKLPNCLSVIMLQTVIITGLFSTFFTACKKDEPKKNFKQYEGQWKPASFWKWDGLKAFSGPSGIYYMQWKDKMIYIEMEFRADTIISGNDTIFNTNVSKEKYRDTCDFTYSITTTVDESAKLSIDEHYVLYKNGIPYKRLDYGGTTQLVEGQSDYSLDYYHKKTIYPDSIFFSEHYWSGFNAWNSSRKLIRQ